MGVVVKGAQSCEVVELELLGGSPPLPGEDGKVQFGGGGCWWESAWGRGRKSKEADGGAGGEEGGQLLPVCVTSAASYIGRTIVDCLLDRGYCVRLAVDSQGDLEKLGEMEALEGRGGSRVGAVMADLTDVDNLCVAFDGCAGVFHTSAFVDADGISGYSKHMADLEAAAAANVVKACTRTQSVRRCVFTSSLLACVWPRHAVLGQRRHAPALLDESCWSDETLCRDKKLWLALGKTMAERAAWRAARGGDVKLATLCPALLTGLGFCSRNSTASVAYLKGGGEMYAAGLLATAQVGKVAEAHVCVYEAMSGAAAGGGRYVCFDRVVCRDEDAAELGRQLGLAKPLPDSAAMVGDVACFELSNGKLRRLMSRRRCSQDVHR